MKTMWSNQEATVGKPSQHGYAIRPSFLDTHT